MVLKLSLPENKFVWALAHPVERGYIHQQSATGYQECTLIISQADAQPVEVILEDYPEWAQLQILSSIRAGEINNTGDPIDEVEKEQETVPEVVVEAPKVVKKKTTKKKTKKRQTRKEKDE